jgi:hypothetical protein
MTKSPPSTPGPSPSPARGYEPFAPPESPAPYDELTASRIAGLTPAGGLNTFASVVESPSEQGVFVSVDDIAALQQWAEEREELQQWATDRNSLNQRLDDAEQLAKQREHEVDDLRAKLAQAQQALRRDSKQEADSVGERRPLQEMNKLAVPRRSATEINAMASQRQGELEQRKQQEVDSLREEYRRLRSARDAAGAGVQKNAMADRIGSDACSF